jgi:hypothetical protein
MADYVEYGDTSGTIDGRTSAGDQPLPTRPIPISDGSAYIFGDADTLAGRAVGGDDSVVTGSFVANFLFGDARLISEDAQGGNDRLGAAGFTNTLHGDAHEMTGRARGGDDDLQAGGGPFIRTSAENVLYGDAYRMSDRTEGGDDTLTGSNGYLGSTSRLFGDAYVMTDRAEGGDDRLVSGARDDEMWGDAYTVSGRAEGGDDVFVFAPGNGRDIIHDFEPGKDRIDLSAFGGYGVDNFADIAPQTFEQSDGTLIVLDFGDLSSNSVVVAGVFGLGDDDFLFG